MAMVVMGLGAVNMLQTFKCMEQSDNHDFLFFFIFFLGQKLQLVLAQVQKGCVLDFVGGIKHWRF